MTEFEKYKYEKELLAKYSKSYNQMRTRIGVVPDPEFPYRDYQDKTAESSDTYELLRGRLGLVSQPDFTPSSVQGVNDLAQLLVNKGGLTQQERMIRDKRKTLDKAVLYSYQGAFVKKYYPDYVELMDGVREQPPVRALINPDKNKQDYDDKIISIGYEHDFHPGDIFEWIGTGTYWLVYLQELTELAYFRGEIRKCSYQISWKNEDGNIRSTFAAIRGPVETKINYIQKHGISVDEPNYSLHILMPLNPDTKKQFRRYSKFYLQNDDVCWRVEAIDWISTPGILEITAVEYYANETEDDIANGIVGGLIIEPASPNQETVDNLIEGEVFIKPKKEYVYKYTGDVCYTWKVDPSYPVNVTINSEDPRQVTIKWTSNYSGQFELVNGDCVKTIVVESLF